ncbi:T-complex protein 1 subunit gamma [Hondaea fermentalgiana]|uniref:T-complex protein 1 subunit gamma n=1 Tax=Hondaea fermentalgiana TaxID=2315210 RepID=A0A2R5G4R5_9STRA|nr:T-complex protein 1 subunit gamma [Hondaea fermentalgiana]|eukprot:GBG26022.1 T-complex protein 1 subunit gamma [Hondaea fermentalgiana]
MMGGPGGQVFVLNQTQKRESGRKTQLANVQAARAVSDIVRTTLGPNSALKMLIDSLGGIVLTNDGHAILRELDVSHPAAKSMLELARSQDEEAGDGSTSVIVLSGEMLTVAEPFLRAERLHPTQIVQAYYRAMEEALAVCERIARPLDVHDRDSMFKIVDASVGTKYVHRWGDLIVNMALDAVMKITVEGKASAKEVDIKRYARIEKIPGGELSDCTVMDGVMLNKDVTHSKMKRRIENPRILLLDCSLEYKKGESQTSVELTNDTDWDVLLKLEEEHVERLCADIISHKPDLVLCEKGVSDLAQHYLQKAGITALRRLRKTDNNRVARATGATIVSRTEEIQETDIGTGCGLFEVRKIGDEYFSFIEKCKDPKACTLLLRGGSKDVLNEVERNIQDAMQVAKNIVLEPKVLPGGGATEMAIAQALSEKSKTIEGVQQWPYKAVGIAFEVIPRTLLENCGVDVVRRLTELRAMHAQGGNERMGVNGETGVLVSMDELNIWEPFSVKTQIVKTSIEAAAMLLRVDDVVSGSKKN